MFSWLRKHKPVLISRDDLKIKIFEEFACYVHEPLNMRYKLIPDKSWILKRTPWFDSYEHDFNDCNHFACVTMSKMQSHCVGMVRLMDDTGFDHTENIVMLESGKLLLYNPIIKQFREPDGHKVRSMWV